MQEEWLVTCPNKMIRAEEKKCFTYFFFREQKTNKLVKQRARVHIRNDLIFPNLSFDENKLLPPQWFVIMMFSESVT